MASPLLVVGHKNPDTDSICSAIAYAAFKSEIDAVPALACRAGSINAQTRFALDSFDAEDPRLLTDVLPRLSDIMIGGERLLTVSPEQPLRDAYSIITRQRFSFLPVVDDLGICIGKVTALGIAGLLTRLDEFASSGKTAPGCEPGIGEVVEALLDRPISGFLDPVGPTFLESSPIRDVEHEVNRSNEGGFIVTADDGRITGVVTRMNFLTDSRFRVALVDHNEFSQAVDGIDEALVVEVIDHHRIGLERTTQPITVINRVVGSTCTIVAERYRQAGSTPSVQIAGLMLSGLLSDTVILSSPTTTATDREIARWLAGVAGVELEEYGTRMFSAGSEIGTRDAAEVIGQDQKFYREKGHAFAVSQIEMVGFQSFWSRAADLHTALERVVAERELYFAALMVTDITTSTTLLLVSGARVFTDRIAYPQPEPSVFEMKGVLSRKKQVLPMLLELL